MFEIKREFDYSKAIYDTDSYKCLHKIQYPVGIKKSFSYLEARGSEIEGVDEIVVFGLQYHIAELMKTITKEDIEEAKPMFNNHIQAFSLEDDWNYIVEKHEGKLPVIIRSVPEGTVVPVGNVIATIENTDDRLFWLPNYIETKLMRVWKPITVATISREYKKIIKAHMEKTCDNLNGLPFMVHDFSSRSASSYEDSFVGSMAHLTSFLGTDTTSVLFNLKKYYNCDIGGYSVYACYDDKTEILTPKGFRLFKDLEESELVAQYTDKGNIEFVNYTNYIARKNTEKMYNFKTNDKNKNPYVDLMVTETHRMVRKSIAKEKLEIFQAKDFKLSHRNKMILGGAIKNTKYDNVTLSYLERLLIAFQADGSFFQRNDEYTGKKTGTFPIRFSLKREDKKSKLKTILENLKFEYSISTGKSDKEGYESFYIKIPIEHKNVVSKNFDWIDLSKVSTQWCNEFIQEIGNWDGSFVKDRPNSIVYTSTNKYNIDFVQAICSLSNIRTKINEVIDNREDCNRKTLYHLSMLLNKSDVGGETIDTKIESAYSGMVYCITVPSGMIVVRRNNAITICGNCEHSVVTSYGKDNESFAYSEIYKRTIGQICSVVSDSYDIENAILNIWGEELLPMVENGDKTVVIRLDCGDTVEMVRTALNLMQKRFSHYINTKGYKVFNKVKILQGDGVNFKTMKAILEVLDELKFATDVIVFGIGSELCHKFNRDTFKFAIKMCANTFDNIVWNDVYKDPKGSFKKSKKGLLGLYMENGKMTTKATDYATMDSKENLLQPIFKNGDFLSMSTLDDIRNRLGGV